MAIVFIKAIGGGFASKRTRKIRVFSNRREIFGAAATGAIGRFKGRAARKPKPPTPSKAKKRPKPKPGVKLPGRTLRQDYKGPFKRFLERLDARGPNELLRAVAVMRIVLLDYPDQPTRDVSIFLGRMKRKTAEKITQAEVLRRARGRWGRVQPVWVFIAALKGGSAATDETRQEIAATDSIARKGLIAGAAKRAKPPKFKGRKKQKGRKRGKRKT